VKNVLKVLVVALITVAFSGISFAQDKPATPATPATPPAPAMEKKTEMKSEKAKTTRITGEVTSVDSKAGTLTVKTKDKETNLIADSNAKGALGKVKVGDMVKATYTEKDGKMLASSIAGVKSKAKKSEKAPAK
jgi:ribosomal protein S1